MNKKTLSSRLAVTSVSDTFGFQVGGLARAYRRVIDKRMAQMDIAPSHWPLLLNLWYYEGVTQQELADMLEMTRGGMNKLINRLELAGYLRREGGHDLRSKRIFLEDAIRPLVQRMDEVQKEIISASMGVLSRQEAETLSQLLQTV